MLKEIKVIDRDGNQIIPDKKSNLITIPVNGRIEFVDVQTAKDLISIIRGQLNILEAQRIERKTGNRKHTTHIDGKENSST
jgi:hypothetical protein